MLLIVYKQWQGDPEASAQVGVADRERDLMKRAAPRA